MRYAVSSILLLIACLPAAGQEATGGAQVSTAAADALDALHRQILSAPVAPGIIVQDVIDRVGGNEELVKTLRSAQQIGGVRWLDDQTAQVRLVIDGGPIAATLIHLVEQNPKKSPISVQAIRRDLKSWSSRTFAATGTSTSATDIARLQPPSADKAWWGVSDEARRAAVSSARDNAVSHVIDSLRPIQLDNNRTLDDALAVPEVGQAVRNWLWSRPVRSVEFDDDLSVRLELSAPPDQLWPVVKDALSHQTKLPAPMGQANWDWLEAQVIPRMASAVGRGVVAQAPRQPAQAQALVMPAQPPAWAVQMADADATAPSQAGNALRTARAAQAIAMEKLRREVEALPLTADTTVGQAAARDPRVQATLARALTRCARPYKVDYLAKGAVTVHISLNLADLWAELSR